MKLRIYQPLNVNEHFLIVSHIEILFALSLIQETWSLPKNLECPENDRKYTWATPRENVSLGVSDQACAATEASYSLEISAIESRDITLSKQRTTKALIKLHGCASWSGPLLFAYDIRHIFSWFVCLCWGLTSQSTIFQSCLDGATASWVINQYCRGVKCLAQGHNTAAVGFEPPTSRSGVRHSTTEPPRSPHFLMARLTCVYQKILSFWTDWSGLTV